MLLVRRTGSHHQVTCPAFSCDSGDCIPLSLTCDGTDNCFDNTDEAVNGSSHCKGKIVNNLFEFCIMKIYRYTVMFDVHIAISLGILYYVLIYNLK